MAELTFPEEAVDVLARLLAEEDLPRGLCTDDRWQRLRTNGSADHWVDRARRYLAAVAEFLPADRLWVQRAIPVLRYVSAGRSYVDIEPYPEATARALLGELEQRTDHG